MRNNKVISNKDSHTVYQLHTFMALSLIILKGISFRSSYMSVESIIQSLITYLLIGQLLIKVTKSNTISALKITCLYLVIGSMLGWLLEKYVGDSQVSLSLMLINIISKFILISISYATYNFIISGKRDKQCNT